MTLGRQYVPKNNMYHRNTCIIKITWQLKSITCQVMRLICDTLWQKTLTKYERSLNDHQWNVIRILTNTHTSGSPFSGTKELCC